MPTVFVYWSKSRTASQKEAVTKGITKSLVESGNARQEDVVVFFQDINKDDMIRGRDLSFSGSDTLSKDNSESD